MHQYTKVVSICQPPNIINLVSYLYIYIRYGRGYGRQLDDSKTKKEQQDDSNAPNY